MLNTADHLEKYGIKPSPQRIAVMDYLMKNRTHPTADEIYTALAPSIPTLSKTTVYNTLNLLVENGAAQSITIDERNVRFDAETMNHAHFRCIKCGRIIDLFPSELDQADPITIKQIGTLVVTQTHVYYKGYCSMCSDVS